MKRIYRQQLVLQFPGRSLKDYDSLIELEDRIIGGLGNFGEVDGHDMGVGEMNIFIHTDHPKLTFEQIKSLIGTCEVMRELKAAYRDVGQESFTILHPADLKHFSIA